MAKEINGYWQERIESQLTFLESLKEVPQDLILSTRAFLKGKISSEGAITKNIGMEAENMLKDAFKVCKEYRILCVAHAHIDMNWMWGFGETVAITLETFRTMLNLMEEYPMFTFSQSQASVYRIVQEHDPDLLEEIKRRVGEKRFEVTASTWVETDKNMPSGESLARHILYTKRYLSELLDIDPKSLVLDFEPDTFGHSRNVPEILNCGGIKYYYHCRGYDGHVAYRWKSPSGSFVLVYREPFWYNATIEPSMAFGLSRVCNETKIKTMLKVYGVGDHGGGPTRRDIERIIDMAAWPAFPRIEFGTFREFFDELDGVKDELPVVDDELNYVFTGCYTSQSRIKTANRIGEGKLYESEALSALSKIFAGGRDRTKAHGGAWEKVLFSHFHDILPGSCVIDTRQYALGKFQEVLATANTNISSAIRSFTDKIHTTGYLEREDYSRTVSEGGGAGHGIKDFGVPRAERGKGRGRVLHFFNPTPYGRREVVEAVIWDWPGDPENICMFDHLKREVEFQVLPDKKNSFSGREYWGHSYIRIMVKAEVPAWGYTTCFLTEGAGKAKSWLNTREPRVNRNGEYVLENEKISVRFDKRTMEILSFEDRGTGTDLIRGKSGIFRLIKEDDVRKMTSWIVGRYMGICNLNENENVKITSSHMDKDALYQWIEYEIGFNQSRIRVTVSLDKYGDNLDYMVNCDWQERAVKNEYVPQLNFHVPLGYSPVKYKYDVPFGVIDRDERDDDVPANSFIAGVPRGEMAHLMLISRTKYGFRGFNNSMALSLLRSSYDPDPYPEMGIHDFGFSLMLAKGGSTDSHLVKKSIVYNHPIIYIPGRIQEGIRPMEASLLEIQGVHAILSAIKTPEGEEGRKLLLRFYETDGIRAPVRVKFPEEIKGAYFCDINENFVSLAKFKGDSIEFIPDGNRIVGLMVEFKIPISS